MENPVAKTFFLKNKQEHGLQKPWKNISHQTRDEMHPSYTHIDERINVQTGNKEKPYYISRINMRDLHDGTYQVSLIFPMLKDDEEESIIKKTRQKDGDLAKVIQKIPGTWEGGFQTGPSVFETGIGFTLYDLLSEEGYNAYTNYTGIMPGTGLNQSNEEDLEKRVRFLENIKSRFPEGTSTTKVQLAAIVYMLDELDMVEQEAVPEIYESLGIPAINKDNIKQLLSPEKNNQGSGIIIDAVAVEIEPP